MKEPCSTRNSSALMEKARKVMKSSADSWRMDETTIKVKGQWAYLYRVVDKFGANRAGINAINVQLAALRHLNSFTHLQGNCA